MTIKPRKNPKKISTANKNFKPQNQKCSKTKENLKKDNSTSMRCSGKFLQTINKANTVKRSQVRVRSAKGKRNINVANVQKMQKKNRKEERKLKTDRKSNLNVRSCHHSFTNLYYDF